MEWANCGGQRRRELAEKLGLDSQQVERTIGEFNDAVQEGEFDPFEAGRQGDQGSRAAQEQLGFGPSTRRPFRRTGLREESPIPSAG